MNFPPGLQPWSYFRAEESRLQREECRNTGLEPVTLPVCGVIGSRGPDGYCGFAKVRSTVSGFLYHFPGRVSCVLIMEGAELYSNIILCSLMVRGQQ